MFQELPLSSDEIIGKAQETAYYLENELTAEEMASLVCLKIISHCYLGSNFYILKISFIGDLSFANTVENLEILQMI